MVEGRKVLIAGSNAKVQIAARRLADLHFFMSMFNKFRGAMWDIGTLAFKTGKQYEAYRKFVQEGFLRVLNETKAYYGLESSDRIEDIEALPGENASG